MTKPILYATALSSALLVQYVCCASATDSLRPAFATLPRHRLASVTSRTPRFSAAIDDIPSEVSLEVEDDASAIGSGGDPESILQARNRLVALSATLADNSPSGKFITRPSDKVKLQKAVNDLEALSSSPSDRDKETMLGDWTLVVTANLPSSDIRRRFNSNKKDGEKKGWGKKKRSRSGLSLFGSEGQDLNPIQKSIRKTVTVTQRIRNDGTNPAESGGDINRVDNVVEVTPLDTLESIIPEESPLFGLLGNVNVNPLQIKNSKVVLVHKAEVESVKPVLRTKIGWTSSILNVAGTSQNFDPEGADVFGINNLFGEFINVGTFDTPFVDEDIRISRTSGPVLEQLRVFVRKGSSILDEGMLDSLAAEMRVEEEKEVSSSDDVGSQVKKVVDAVASTAEDARATIEKDMDGVSKALGDTMDDVVSKVQDAVEDDLEQIGKAVESVQSAIQDGDRESIGEALTNVTKAVAKVPEDVRNIVEEDASELGDKVEEVLDSMVADVQDVVEADLEDVQKSIGDVRDAATGGDADDDEEAKED